MPRTPSVAQFEAYALAIAPAGATYRAAMKAATVAYARKRGGHGQRDAALEYAALAERAEAAYAAAQLAARAAIGF